MPPSAGWRILRCGSSVYSNRMWKAADGVGAIEVLEVMGNDLTVVNAARVSFAKESHDFSGADEKLVNYLARHNHVTPFFHPQIRLRIKMPIFVAREWFRHQIGFARNEVSRRYVDSTPEVWTPAPYDVRERDPKVKQGSLATSVDNSDTISEEIGEHNKAMVAYYQSLLDRGVAPEIARSVLPQAMYTEFIETGSLAAYARLVGLRTDPTAQKEIQSYAYGILDLLHSRFPVSWKALTTKTEIRPTVTPDLLYTCNVRYFRDCDSRFREVPVRSAGEVRDCGCHPHVQDLKEPCPVCKDEASREHLIDGR